MGLSSRYVFANLRKVINQKKLDWRDCVISWVIDYLQSQYIFKKISFSNWQSHHTVVQKYIFVCFYLLKFSHTSVKTRNSLEVTLVSKLGFNKYVVYTQFGAAVWEKILVKHRSAHPDIPFSTSQMSLSKLLSVCAGMPRKPSMKIFNILEVCTQGI